MDIVVLILLILAVVVALLAFGGMVANRRRQAGDEAMWAVRVQEANEQLAAAHAEDKGWAPEALDAAARQAFVSERPGAAIEDLQLVQVLDRPGIEEDEAVFSVRSGGRRHELVLGRKGGAWALERLR